MKKLKKNTHLKNYDFVYSLISFFILILVVLLRFFIDKKIELSQLLNFELLVSVLVVFILTSISSGIVKSVTLATEDNTKLDDDYDFMMTKYEKNSMPLIYTNSKDSDFKLGRKKTKSKMLSNNGDCDEYKIAIGDIVCLYNKEIKINYIPEEEFLLPEFSKQHYTELMAAHGGSKTYNQTMLRLDNIYENNNVIKMFFSKTTYFNSLVTNRALDYEIEGVTLRDLYAYGPFLTPLKDSKLSNHLGFNGMISTSDEYFIFIKRGKHVSIAKNTLQCSIAASLKTKYAIKDNKLTKENIKTAICEEIFDELKLEKLIKVKNCNVEELKKFLFSDFSFENNVLYFYRDFLEGGKPQLMFYYKLNVSYKELSQAYEKKADKIDCSVDGHKMLFVKKEDINKIYMTSDTLVIENKHYYSTPSAVGTLALMLKAFDEGFI
ncbi:MAG: hypothetical protein J6B88_01685 [Clostridia bacterium]|nr:hypothetical protein [Clostridia bacterium]